ncbi:MAG: UPF0149 family protein [Gammaproteobacteria bacterium]|jgi:uncharacterized protein YgfB (UPF0149 family)|nr:UPF0149 family protein [Gammaproteobacteria bacterium]MBQ0774848.1 UPF0149 family protein [Gammaproteobacteria bacterium]|tara:strand:+ start:6329 stop:6928 length:600 start_codon:yes stop_codon:yes gene_type:complete
MTNTESDLFEPLATLLLSEAPLMNPAELHGVICGLLSSDTKAATAHILGVLASHAALRDGWSAEAEKMLVALSEDVGHAFQGEALDLTILLPGDDQPLSERVVSLAVWCEGFMVGFGTGTAGLKDVDLPHSLQEAIADLAAISQVETPDDEDSEGEKLFEQVLEHCRVSALLVFTELALMRRRKAGKAGSDESNEPVRH